MGLTRGQVLTFGGRPIDAFYYSTCGGHTADGVEAFRAASRPYLRSFADVDEHGQAYCRISPRYRWREEWTGDALRMTLRRTLPTTLGVGADRASEVRDIWVAQRTASGRVGRLGITLPADHLMVEGPARTAGLTSGFGRSLRSAAFTLSASRSGREITRLVAEGSGAGHGVGMCQWGAVGRLARRPGLPAHSRGVFSRRDATALLLGGSHDGQPDQRRAAQGGDHRRGRDHPGGASAGAQEAAR